MSFQAPARESCLKEHPFIDVRVGENHEHPLGYFSRFGCSISSRSPPLSIAATMSSKHILLFASDLSSRFLSGLQAIVLIARLYGQSRACQIQAFEPVRPKTKNASAPSAAAPLARRRVD